MREDKWNGIGEPKYIERKSFLVIASVWAFFVRIRRSSFLIALRHCISIALTLWNITNEKKTSREHGKSCHCTNMFSSFISVYIAWSCSNKWCTLCHTVANFNQKLFSWMFCSFCFLKIEPTLTGHFNIRINQFSLSPAHLLTIKKKKNFKKKKDFFFKFTLKLK